MKKEYITACLTAIVAAAVGLAAPDRYGMPLVDQRTLAFFVVILLLIGGRMALTLRQLSTASQHQDDGRVPLPISRIRRMTMLWYGLSIVLVAPVVIRLGQWMGAAAPVSPRPLAWLTGLGSLAIVVFCAWRLWLFIKTRTHESNP